MIDLRSDTVTRPTDAMRAAMAAAEVGDDVYSDDPTVNDLEARTAALLGKEAAMFVVTGSMSNQVAVRSHTEPGDLVLIDPTSHIVLNEGGASAALAGVTMGPLAGTDGVFDADQVNAAIVRAHPFNPSHLQPPARLLCVENTHNAGGGTVWPLDQLRAVAAAGRSRGLALHLDGARLWHASAASGVAEADYAEPFDTVSVCFSKGLGAPVGSALAGTAALILRARRFKQQYGGGFRQAGVLAAAALYALENHRSALGQDIRNARVLADGLATIDGIDLDRSRVQSNIVRFEVRSMRSADFSLRCHERGVHMLPNGDHGMRAVLHRDISVAHVEEALRTMRAVLAGIEQASSDPASAVTASTS